MNNKQIDNNQVGLPDRLVIDILRLVQQGYSCHLGNGVERNYNQDKSIDGDIDAPLVNYQSNIVGLFLVCTYWARRIVPHAMLEYQFMVPYQVGKPQKEAAPVIQGIKSFLKNVLPSSIVDRSSAKQTTMPLNRLYQSLAILGSGKNDDDQPIKPNKVRTLKVFIEQFGRELPPGLNASVFASITLVSATLRRLTLYSVEVNDTLLGVSECKQLERLYIYPINRGGAWQQHHNGVLLRILDATPSIRELAVKSNGSDMSAAIPYQMSPAPLANLEKYVWIGSIRSYNGFMTSQVCYESMTNLRDLKVHLNGSNENMTREPNTWARSLQNKDKLTRLRLINCYAPYMNESCDALAISVEEATPGITLFTNLTSLTIDRLNEQVDKFKPDIQVHRLLEQISTLKSLHTLTLKEIKNIEPLDLTSCLDSLPLLTRFKFSISPKFDSSGTVGGKISSVTPSISISLLKYLETNQTIKHFSYTLQHELNAWEPSETVYNSAGHNNQSTSVKFYNATYALEELAHLSTKIGQIKQALESLVRNSETIQQLSIGSTLEPYHCCTQKQDIADPSSIIDGGDLVSLALLTSLQSSVGPKSKLSVIKIDKCLSLWDKTTVSQLTTSSGIIIIPKKSVHKLNNHFKWDIQKTLKDEVYQFKKRINFVATLHADDNYFNAQIVN
ncbi:hypothetical protein DFA_00713 [Cavenderia fasciculata]|uniref:Uncharacterized protein n=1 Tax=Cavenderia fasciculata TaxID=261658 RepID=F4PTG6_CACFS|nr:uncharacterized protein DFA_00713 [Cavenderia fasciculata]EGG20848.1 hypothetical protein DFA_00713 [Cavenderia fasciculata]|eukprot:XP_004358698.1 hypothetical protein DFA_00713 [Cavenderia fasciculata]